MVIGMFLDIVNKTTVKILTQGLFVNIVFSPQFLNTHLWVELLGHKINEYFPHILYGKHYVKVTETL